MRMRMRMGVSTNGGTVEYCQIMPNFHLQLQKCREPSPGKAHGDSEKPIVSCSPRASFI